MGEIKNGDKALVEMNVVGWDKITGDYQIRPEEDTRTFWASGRIVHPIEGMCDKTYEDGLNEAWELAKKIICNTNNGGFNVSELNEIFDTEDFDDVMEEYTPQEAAAKIAEWESKKEIRAGDVVKDSTLKNGYAIVSYVGKGSTCCVIWDDGSCGTYNKNDFVKTGRTIDIAGLLAQIGGAE